MCVYIYIYIKMYIYGSAALDIVISKTFSWGGGGWGISGGQMRPT